MIIFPASLLEVPALVGRETVGVGVGVGSADSLGVGVGADVSVYVIELKYCEGAYPVFPEMLI